MRRATWAAASRPKARRARARTYRIESCRVGPMSHVVRLCLLFFKWGVPSDVEWKMNVIVGNICKKEMRVFFEPNCEEFNLAPKTFLKFGWSWDREPHQINLECWGESMSIHYWDISDQVEPTPCERAERPRSSTGGHTEFSFDNCIVACIENRCSHPVKIEHLITRLHWGSGSHVETCRFDLHPKSALPLFMYDHPVTALYLIQSPGGVVIGYDEVGYQALTEGL